MKLFFASLAALMMTGGLAAPEARAQDASAVEGESVTFTIDRPTTTTTLTTGTDWSSRPIRYEYTTVDDTAENGEDYEQKDGYVIWGASAQNASVSVPTHVDDVDEGSGETFKLQLSKPHVQVIASKQDSEGIVVQWASAGSLFPLSITLTGLIEEPE